MLRNQKYLLALIAGLALCRSTAFSDDNQGGFNVTGYSPCNILLSLLDEVEQTMNDSEQQVTTSITNTKKLQSSLDCFYTKWTNNLTLITANEQQLVNSYVTALNDCCAKYQECTNELKHCRDEYSTLVYLSDACATQAAEKIVSLTDRYKTLAAQRAELTCRINTLLNAQLLQDNQGVDLLITDLNNLVNTQIQNAAGCYDCPVNVGPVDGNGTFNNGACGTGNFNGSEATSADEACASNND